MSQELREGSVQPGDASASGGGQPAQQAPGGAPGSPGNAAAGTAAGGPAQEARSGPAPETARAPEQGPPPYRRRYGRDGRPEGPRPGGGEDRGGRRPYFRKKVCKLCLKKAKAVDYKDVDMLRRFVTDRGKILPRRITGACAKHQRMVSRAIMRARMVALLPFVSR
jgi:small subunit ribosomal protein S18